MNGKITYHQQASYCGKPRCRKCREGTGHGPYWYAYQTINGRTTRTYIGKNLPPEVLAAREADIETAEIITSSPLADLTTVTSRVCVLGQFRLERRIESRGPQWLPATETTWQQRKVRTLLGYLLSCSGRKALRMEIMEALWPDSTLETASHALTRSLNHLRQLLGQGTELNGQRSPLRLEGEWVILAGQQLLWVDADAFEALLTELDHLGADPANAVEQRERLLREAMALYGGDFLPEERLASWAITRRQTLRQGWIRLQLALADLSQAQGVTTNTIEVLDRLLATDPANEAAVQRLIVVLAQLKRRVEALRAYHRFADVLQREYQTTPSQTTHDLYEAVRQGNALSPSVQPDALPLAAAMANLSTIETTPAPRLHTRGGTTLTSDSSTIQIGRTHQSPLVGRDRELAALRSMLLDVEQGVRTQIGAQRRNTGIPLDTQRHPQCMLLMGEAGIGKTRLAEEMSREAQRRGWSVIWSRAYAQESGIPYRLWTEALRKTINLTQGAWPQPVGAGLAPAVRLPHESLLQPLTALLPELDEIFISSGPGHIGQSLPLQPEQEQLRLWEATRNLLTNISENTPLLIVLDDVQWADGSSYELLGYLARHIHGFPILLIGTCRDSELPTNPPHPFRVLVSHMQREHSVKTLAVDPLTSEQIAQLVSHLPEPMVQHIQEQAAGNPFFAEELARTTPPTLPRTIAAALDHRMSRLSRSCQQLLGNAAVLGGSFEFPIISAMEAGSALADEDTVLDLLEEALQSGVLTEEGTGTRITYHFWHPLLVSHLYDRVSATRRARLHQRAADVLLRMHQGREEEVAATITHHLVKGGAEPARIAQYAESAGDRAYVLSAYPEAERHYALAIENRDSKPPTTHEQLHLAYLLERLAECTMIRGKFVEARHLYERLLELRGKLSTSATETAFQEEAQMQALLWGNVGWTWRYTGDNARARSCCEHGEQVLRDAGVVAGPAWARLRYQQSSLYWQEGRYDDALHAAQEALTLFEQQQKFATTLTDVVRRRHTTRIQRTLEGDPVDLGRTYRLLGALAAAVGKLTEALIHLNTALALYERYDHQREIAHVSCNLGHVHIKKAEHTLAQAALRRSLSLAERIGDTPITSVIFSNLADLAASLENWEEAESWYKRALALAARFNDREYISRWNVGLATVSLEQDKLDEAVACSIRALRTARAMPNNPCIGVALVALGNIRIKQALTSQNIPKIRARLLAQARRNVERALALTGLEAETRTKGHLTLAHLSLLSGNKKAREELAQVVEEAHRYELALVEDQARRLQERRSRQGGANIPQR